MSGATNKPGQSRLFRNPQWLGFPHDGYDIVPFNEYVKLRLQDDHSKWRASLAASQQSVLTFGLLEAVTEQHIPESRLLKIEDGKTVLDRGGLVDISRDFVKRILATPKEELEPWFQRVQQSLSFANSLLVYHMKRKFTVFDDLGDDAPAMVCFAACVGDALVKAKMVFPSSSTRMQAFSWNFVWVPPYVAMFKEDMVSNGWCPSIVKYFINELLVSSIAYAVSCGPAQDGRCHNSCSDDLCATYVIDEQTYTAKHASSCTSLDGTAPDPLCIHSMPPLEDVKRFLLEGEIPVITVVDGPYEHSVELKVHKASDVPYIAISHVWSDGLGGTTETGLPTCQLRRLASLVSSIQPGAAFWIDGICIPKTNAVRKKAIGLMARTYSDAAAVIVLDGGLQHCHSTESPGATALRVLVSGWMRRLWTLQEAVLAKKLYFVFADAPLLLEDLFPSSYEMTIFVHLTDLAAELYRLTKLAKGRSYTISDVSHSLRWRSTSRPSDETLAIASLLGAHASDLVDLNQENRMIRLLQDLGTFPRNILLLHGAKLSVPGFRWAPTSFMQAHGGGGGNWISPGAHDAILTARGLRARYYALVFETLTFEAGKDWKIMDPKHGRHYSILETSELAGNYTCNMLLLLEGVPRENGAACAAVLGAMDELEREGEGKFTVHCAYARRLWIVDRTANTDGFEDALSCTLSGKVDVCVS